MRQFKEMVLLVIALAAAVLALYVIFNEKAQAEPPDSYHSGLNLVRATADEDGATFAAVYDLTGASGTLTPDFAGKDSSSVANGGPFHIVAKNEAGAYGVPISPGDTWAFMISGENFNNVDDTFSFNAVGWARGNGMLQNICEGDGVLGTNAVVVYPDGGDALGALISETGVAYTHATTTFVTTGNGFAGAVVGMLARVTGTNITNNEIVQVTTVTDDNTIICSGVTSTDNNTDSTVQINPAFWADTITLDETTKWPKQHGDMTGAAVYNSADNEVAILVIQTKGIEWIQFVIYDADGATGEQAGNITVYGRRW